MADSFWHIQNQNQILEGLCVIHLLDLRLSPRVLDAYFNN